MLVHELGFGGVYVALSEPHLVGPDFVGNAAAHLRVDGKAQGRPCKVHR